MANAELVFPSGERKVPVSIRLEPEVIEFFKREGPGYQSRISAVLLAYVRSRRRRQGSQR
ncbi:MAG: BrnA antitoxin family protein [Longimicrobiales bacterium]